MSARVLVSAVAVAVIFMSACGASSTRTAQPAATSTTTAPPSTATIVRPTTLVDQLVTVHGARLHVHCDGAGATTVVLISGFGGDRSSWTAVEPALSRTTRVCSYERFGDGTSDVPPATQTFTTEAADLHELLQSIGDPGPYVIVGHSFGGAEAVAFTSMFPGEVRGLVLVDTSPPSWNTAICAVPDDGSAAASEFRSLCVEQSNPANNVEHLDAPAAFGDVGAIRSLGAVPMIVMTADRHRYPGLAGAEESRLDDVWATGQAHWVSLSASAQLVTVTNTSHNIQLDHPDAVLDNILEVVG